MVTRTDSTDHRSVTSNRVVLILKEEKQAQNTYHLHFEIAVGSGELNMNEIFLNMSYCIVMNCDQKSKIFHVVM